MMINISILKKISAILVMSWLFFMISCSKDKSLGAPDTKDNSELPFKRGAEGYAYFRIPAMVITNNETVLAFAEGRVNGREDSGDIDIVLKRSTDRGKTWSELIVVKNDGVNRCSNPAPVVIPETGRILLLYCWNLGAVGFRRIFVTYSDDDGVTWAPERDITSSVKDPSWNWYATGPCHAIVKERSPNKGRIVVPTNHTEGRSENYSQIIYSDDQGVTWHIGAEAPVQSNESTVVELSTGEIMLNMRNPPDATNRTRIVALSADGGETFYKHYNDPQLTEPICQASLVFHSINPITGKGNILFSNPPGTVNRVNNTIRLSTDDGLTWTKKLQYVPNGETGAYSDLAVFKDGTIAIFHELGYLNFKGLAFKTVKITDLK